MTWRILEITEDEGQIVYGAYQNSDKRPRMVIQFGGDEEELIEYLLSALNMRDSAEDALLSLPEIQPVHYDIIFTPEKKRTRKPAAKKPGATTRRKR